MSGCSDGKVCYDRDKERSSFRTYWRNRELYETRALTTCSETVLDWNTTSHNIAPPVVANVQVLMNSRNTRNSDTQSPTHEAATNVNVKYRFAAGQSRVSSGRQRLERRVANTKKSRKGGAEIPCAMQIRGLSGRIENSNCNVSIFRASVFRLACHEREKWWQERVNGARASMERVGSRKIDDRSCLSTLTWFVPSVNF